MILYLKSSLNFLQTLDSSMAASATSQMEVEMPTQLGTQRNEDHSSCNSICSFINQEQSISDSDQRSRSKTKLRFLILFYVIVMLVEIYGGIKSNSLAILTDAAHLLTDIAGFLISLLALWASAWEPTPHQTFGFNRIEVLGALLSVQLIWLISGFLIYEAFDKILHKNSQVNGRLMFIIAAFGFVMNLIMVLYLGHDHNHHGHDHNHHHGHDHHHHHHHGHDHDHHHHHEKTHDLENDEDESSNLVHSPHDTTTTPPLNINLQGAYLHVITDLIQSAGVMISGSIIWVKPGWLVVDLGCTIVFSIFALYTTLPMLKSIFCILMEGTPSEIDVIRIENDIRCIKGVCDVHDLHVWAVTLGKLLLVCHVRIEDGGDSNKILDEVRDCCERKYKICHVTVQIEQTGSSFETSV